MKHCIIQEGMEALKVEYEIYAKLFGKNLIKLNLTVCGQSKILVSIPIILYLIVVVNIIMIYATQQLQKMEQIYY